MQNQASGVRNAKPQEFRLSRRVAASFNNLLETNRRHASPRDAVRRFGRRVYARIGVPGSGRSANR